jgi:hypothetical protein
MRLIYTFGMALLFASCGGSSFRSSGKDAGLNGAKPTTASELVEKKKAVASQNSDQQASSENEKPMPKERDSDGRGAVNTSKGECGERELLSMAKISLRENEEHQYPLVGADGGRWKFTLKTPPPHAVSLMEGKLKVGPGTRPESANLQILAEREGRPECKRDLFAAIPADGVLISPQPLTLGARGELFILGDSGNYPTKSFPGNANEGVTDDIRLSMPDFDKMIKSSEKPDIYVPRFEINCVPSPTELARACLGENGFVIDGYRDLKSYFGYRFTTYLVVDEPGAYAFRTYSDDGSVVTLMEGPGLDAPAIAVVNGGDHSVEERTGRPMELRRGIYKMRVDWYQGPIGHFNLEVSWKKPGDSGFSIIPPQKLLVNPPQ